MIAIAVLIVRMLCDCFKSPGRLATEILILRHQLNVLQQRRQVLQQRRQVDCICVGSTVPYSFGSIVAGLASLMP
jgi:histidinol dehydrogenase